MSNETVTKLTYRNQSNILGWNEASVALADNILRLRIVASKIAFTADTQFIILDDIAIERCQQGIEPISLQ